MIIEANKLKDGEPFTIICEITLKKQKMTPEEKAKQLVDKFCTVTAPYEDISARQMAILCALISVNEIIDCGLDNLIDPKHGALGYWYDVKEEIKKL